MKRSLIWVLIVSVIIVALISVFVVLSNRWGWLQIRVAFTTVICAVSSLCVFACYQTQRHNGNKLLARLGLLLVTVGAPLYLVLAWVEDRFIYEHLNFYRISNIIVLFALATVHLSLLSMARLQPKYKWVFWLAVSISYGTAVLASYYNFLDYTNQQHNVDVLRWIYALIVGATSMTAIVPLLHFLSLSEKMDPEDIAVPKQ
jgi:hypothetical protein